jgi:hypothetical protein
VSNTTEATLSRPADVERTTVEALTRQQERRTEGRITLVAETHGVAKRTPAEAREVVVRGRATLLPVVADVVHRVERVRHLDGTCRVRDEAAGTGFACDEVPERRQSRHAAHLVHALRVNSGGIVSSAWHGASHDDHHAGYDEHDSPHRASIDRARDAALRSAQTLRTPLLLV